MPRTVDTVLWGITRSGRTFRPSDWAERLAGLTAAFKLNERLTYSRLVLPVIIRGVRALIVRGELHEKEPRLHQFLLNFARDNELLTAECAPGMVDPQSLVPPAVTPGREPREPV